MKMLWTEQPSFTQGLEFPATGSCAQAMRQQAPCVVSTGEHRVEMCGKSSSLEARISSGSSPSLHPLREQRAWSHSERRQEGLWFWWYPQDQVSSLTCRRVRAFDLKIRPFLPEIYLMEEIACPYKSCLTSIRSPPCLYPLTSISSSQPLLFFLLAPRKKLILI